MYLIISKWLRIQKCRQKWQAMRQNGQSEKRNCQQNCFHSFYYVIDRASICFFFYINNLHYFLWFFLYYLQDLLSSGHFTALTILEPATFFIEIYEFFKKIIYRKGVFQNVSLSNLENVLQRDLRTGRARESIFRVSGGTDFENISAWGQPWWCLSWFDVCISLPQKNSGCVTG